VDDRYAEDDKPVVNRPPLPQAEVARLLGYLYRAPVVLTRPTPLPDVFVPGPPSVPDAFHTDGTWIWPAAVPHYLRHYGVPPQPELLDHIRALEYRPPYVEARVRATAEAEILGTERPPRTVGDLAEPDPVTRVLRGDEPVTPLRASEVLRLLRSRLAELGVADSAYRIGDTADDAWCLHRTARGWEVARYRDGEPDRPRYFPRVQPAAEALLGALLLMPSRSRLGVPRDAEAREAAANASDWPVLPLPGEPPLTYYRGKRMITLPAGVVVQRFGNESGNVVHPDGTPFPQTSLAFERELDRRRYRVCRPLRVLGGTTLPWARLPGGALAYLLPRAIGHHVETGALERLS
jgi:hypothetical protein